MAKQRHVINNMPLRGGLTTAGQRSTINENQVWGCKNMYPDLDGMMRTRPGTVQHGQQLTVPNISAANKFHELFKSLGSWAAEGVASDYTSGINTGLLTVTQTAGDFYLSRSAADTSADGNYSLKFSMRMTNPAGTANSGGELAVRLTGDAGTTFHEIVLDATGIHVTGVASDVDVFTDTYALDLGAFHSYEFYYNATDDELTIWFDSVEQVTVDMTLATSVTPNDLTCASVELHMSSGTGSWTVMLTDLMYTDMVYAAATLPFTPQRLVDGIQFERLLTGGSTIVSLVVATEDYLYVDIRQRGAWRPLMRVERGHTYMVPYQSELLIFDDNGATRSKLYKWNGVSAPEEVEDTPPVQFGTEYRTRLWSAGDRAFPLRAYYTASRNIDVWFAPEYDPDETFEEVLNAGFILIPAETGDKIRGIYGEYMGIMIIETDRGVWQVSGSSPSSFQVENVSKRVGGASAQGMVQVGNQLFIVGASGVVSVSTAQTYGDLQAAMPSGAIADKWSSLPDISERVDKQQLSHSYFATLPALNLAVLGMRGQGESVLNQMFTYAALSQQWYGPWTLEPTFFSRIEYGTPESELLMAGDEDGRVSFTALSTRTDLGEIYETQFKSPMLCGRTIDPSLTSRSKRWRVLRLFILPRVDKTFNVRWKTDQNGWQPTVSGEDWTQNEAGNAALSDTFRLNIDTLHSQADVEVIEITLDAKGRYFQFEITSDYDFVLQGYQVDFLSGDEEEE